MFFTVFRMWQPVLLCSLLHGAKAGKKRSPLTVLDSPAMQMGIRITRSGRLGNLDEVTLSSTDFSDTGNCDNSGLLLKGYCRDPTNTIGRDIKKFRDVPKYFYLGKRMAPRHPTYKERSRNDMVDACFPWSRTRLAAWIPDEKPLFYYGSMFIVGTLHCNARIDPRQLYFYSGEDGDLPRKLRAQVMKKAILNQIQREDEQLLASSGNVNTPLRDFSIGVVYRKPAVVGGKNPPKKLKAWVFTFRQRESDVRNYLRQFREAGVTLSPSLNALVDDRRRLITRLDEDSRSNFRNALSLGPAIARRSNRRLREINSDVC